MNLSIISLLFSAVFSLPVLAGDESGNYKPLRPVPPADMKDHACDHLLDHDPINDKSHRIVFSGRDADTAEVISKYADILFGKGGVADKLGLSSAHQIIQFLSGSEVNAVAANGRMPVGHWSEGANILRGSGGGLLYEMVISGGMIRHSIYRDDIDWRQQLSILNHVLGHVHFGVHNFFKQTRTTEGNQAAYEFDSLLEKYRERYNRDDVSEWYQYLLTIEWSQDILHGSFQTVDDFRLNPDDVPVGHRGPVANPKVPTANVMQAFIANLPPNTPTWKRTLAEKFAKMVAHFSGAVNTKIINEGFATLMQELLPPHTGYNTFEHAAEYCCMIKGVASKSISNPYWIGLEAWRNIRKAFNARLENQGLDRLELDRRFIAYATKEVIEKMDDKAFLRLGLTDSWLMEQRFALTRKLKMDHWDNNLPPPKPGQFQNPHQYEVVSRDPKEVRESIISSVKGFEYQFPRAVLTDYASDGTGIIKLEISDKVGRELSLAKRSMVQTLMVMARINGLPVSLETTEIDFGNLDPSTIAWYLNEFTLEAIMEMFGQKIVKFRARTVVSPDGKVQVFKVFRNGDPTLKNLNVDGYGRADDRGVEIKLEEMKIEQEKYQLFADEYIADLNLGLETPEDVFRKASSAQRLEKAVADYANGLPAGLLVRMPTIPHAIEEYYNYANVRKMAALRRAIERGKGMHANKNGISVKVFPDIPRFRFTQMSLSLLINSGESNRGLGFLAAPKKSNPWKLLSLPSHIKKGDKILADKLGITEDGGPEGKKYWDEGDADGDSGPGDEDADGEPTNEPGDGRRPGPGGIDPTYMDFDLDIYANLLSEYDIRLPNLRPLDGVSTARKEERGGWAYKKNGDKKWTMITRKALSKAIAYYRAKGIDVDKLSRQEVLRRGFRLLDAKDIVVTSFTEKKEPDVNAVIFVKLDMSGSYQGFIPKTKQLLFDMRALLIKKYKKVKFVFVGFDGSAVATEDPDEFFRMNLGGGTNYTVAFKKTVEMFPSYPESKWDRFSVLAGDFEDGTDPELEQTLDEMRKGVRFMAGIKMGWDFGFDAPVEEYYKRAHQEDPYSSFVDLAPENEYHPLVLKQIFKNEEGKD